MAVSMTKKELASVAGYTYRRLYDIDRELPEGKKLFVPGEGGKCDLALFVQHWVEYNVNNEVGDIEDLETVKARHEVIKTQKTELEVAKMRGQLVDVTDVKQLWGDIANTVMQNMIHLPQKLAPILRMQENTEIISGIIDTEIRKVLDEIVNARLPDYAEEEAESNGGEGDEERESTE